MRAANGEVATATISAEERARRLAALNFARANVGLEGFVPSAEFEQLGRDFVAGELDLAAFVRANLEHSGRLARTPDSRRILEADLAGTRLVEVDQLPRPT